MSPTSRHAYGLYLVAFIDLLGQQDEIMKLAGLPPSPSNESRIVELMARTASRAKSLRETFKRTFTDFPRLAAERAEERPPRDKDRFIELVGKMRFCQLGFADSFVVGLPLVRDDRLGYAPSALAVSSAMYALASLSLRSMGLEGVPLRGGIDVGFGLDLYPDEVYGPVAVSAYRLESKVADYPRIVIGRGVLDYLAHLEGQPPLDWGSRYAARVAIGCRELIYRAPDDGELMLDLLCRTVVALRGNGQAMVLQAREWAKREGDRFAAAGNLQLERRYRRLSVYLSRETGGV